MKDIIVLILAGGDGGRFWPLADKHSLQFLGKPYAYYHILQLAKYGLKNIVIVVNEENKPLFLRLKNEFSKLNINLAVQENKKGMAGAILSAQKFIMGHRVLIRNGSDMYEDLLLSSIISELKNDPDGLISGINTDEYFPGGYLTVSEGKVASIIEKPPPNKLPSNIVTIVFNYFKNANSLLSTLSKYADNSDDIFEKSIDSLIKKGLNFKFVEYKGYWGYLKYPWHVLSIMQYHLNKIKGQKIKKAFIDKSAIISGDVLIEDGVKVMENTKIVGPTYIGHGTIIGQNCLVRESMIGDGCVVGYTTEIARSYIGCNSWFHTNYVGDSVISDNVSMGAGAVLANFRLDEGTVKSFVNNKKIDTSKVKLGSMIGKNARIGVNSSIMPGVKIGKNAFVGAGVLLDRDLLDCKFCFQKGTNNEVVDNRVDISKKTRSHLRGLIKI